MAMGIRAGGVYADMKLNTTPFNKSLYESNRKLNSFSHTMNSMGRGMQRTGDALTKKVTVPLGLMGGMAVKAGMDFESGMSEVQAISGATGKDFEKLEAKAKYMGKTTKFSASQSAEALKYMAMAGWKTNSMLDGLDGVMMLAAASGEELGLVSDIVTDALTAFGMEAKDATKFADLLASASTNSNTNVAMMGETFKYVAPLFGSLGYSAEDAALGIGLMANSGIKASQAGTTLRGAITRLVKPTDDAAIIMKKLDFTMTDAQGNMKPFKQVMDELRQKFKGLTKEQQTQYATTLFGKEAMSGMLAIINATDEDYKKLTKATTDYTGAAKKMSDIMEDNVKGRVTKLKSALEGLAIDGFKLALPYIEKFVGGLQKTVDWLANLNPKTQETIIKLGALAFATGPVLKAGGGLFQGISKITGGLDKLGIILKGANFVTKEVTASTLAANAAADAGLLATGGFAGAMKGAAVAAGPWALAIAGVGVAAYGIHKKMSEEVIPTVDLFADQVEITSQTVTEGSDMMAASYETNTIKISEATKEAVGAYMELDEQAKFHLDSLYINSTKITEETAGELIETYNNMKDMTLAAVEERSSKEIELIQGMMNEESTLTEEEYAGMLEELDLHWGSRKNLVEEYNNRILEIINGALKKERQLTADEKAEIADLQQKARENATRILSEQEREAEIILGRMKANDGRITAEQASEHIKLLNEQKTKAIDEANAEYLDRKAIFEEMKKTATGEQRDMVEKWIKEAERQRDETIEKAEQTRDGAVDKIFEMNSELIDSVDGTNGDIISGWQRLFGTWDRWQPSKKHFSYTVQGTTQSGRHKILQMHATGTNFHPGGEAIVGEFGPELIRLPRGTQVQNHLQTKNELNNNKDEEIAELKRTIESAKKPINLIMNGNIVGRVLAPIVDKEINKNLNIDKSGKGGLAW